MTSKEHNNMTRKKTIQINLNQVNLPLGHSEKFL